MEFLTGIVTYNPDIGRLLQCVESVLNNCSAILIVDNGSHNLEDIRKSLKPYASIAIIENKKNNGIARALNQIFERAISEGYRWVLTLDQDTIIPETLTMRYKSALEDNKSNIAIVCPQIHDDLTNRTWPLLRPGEKERLVEKCITSASLNSVEMWETVGGFDEQLFIDEVDHDYCYRIRKCGGMILLVDDAIINHTIGNSKIYSFLGSKIVVRNHSAFRKYYITRNILLVDRKQHGKNTYSAFTHCFLFTIMTLLFEDKKREKITACVKGILDGVHGV